ncbi:hypothetical protein KP509_1Z053200 [Ceratopteris richardii]|nr:hypothetical protein KP509_1Z053200 [Ceratopteris richardii]KAH6558631.1 hypothetical protein KP509_1Z053200 [Ceratopteris richardii]KAH6558632.1 hypothetical protein KP509_1Z053200 [Ceratopteris richardii]
MAVEVEHRCFIGGLSWETTDRDLESAFRPFGNILEAKVVMNRGTGRSKGFGFVTFGEEKEMQDAIDRMHGMELDGRLITVDKAQGRTGGGRGGSGGGGGRGGGSGDGCFKCGQSGHWARDCSSGDGGGYRGTYGGGRGDRGSRDDRYRGSGGNYYSSDGDRADRSGGKSSHNRDRERYNSSGSSRNNGGHRERAGPYDREVGSKYGSNSGSGRSTYDSRS